MKRRMLTALLVLILMVTSYPMTAFAAAYTPPASYGAPLNPGVVFNGEDLLEDPTNRWSFALTVNASDEVRSLVTADVGYEEGVLQSAGYNSMHVYVQWDYKIDNGKWRYELPGYDDWAPEHDAGFDAVTGVWATEVNCSDTDFEEIFADGLLPGGRTYFDNHTISFRARFDVSFYSEDSGKSYQYYSPWSSVVSYSNKQTVQDPDKLINHAPKLLTADLKKYSGGEPYLDMTADKAPADIQTLNSISAGRVFTNVWIRVNGGQWRDMGSYLWMKEKFEVNALDYAAYFNLTTEGMAAAEYDVKFRYEFDKAYYPAAGETGTIYSPFSNVISHGAPAFYSKATSWAKDALDRAQDMGFITDRLMGADMTQKITREEFAELAVKFYEMETGKSAEPHPTKTFKDCTNPEVLKAFNLKITSGTGDGTTFEPKANLLRQQMATMICNTLKACYTGIVVDYAGQIDFADQKSFAGYAIPFAKFMAKYKITNVTNNQFGPNDFCTREQAVIFLVNALDKKDQYKINP